MRQAIYPLIFSAVLALTSCQKQDNDLSSTITTSSKPLVAIAPVIDRSESGLKWDLSDELTYSLSSKLIQKSKLRVVDPYKVKMQIKKAKIHENPFGSDLGWMKTAFFGEDFVVFMELIEHKEKLRDSEKSKSPEALPADLNLALRLRIVDIRKEQPTIVLQEIIQDSYFIPRQFTRYNFDQAPWNSEDFSISPVGIAHSALIKEISSRIEDYIFLSKSE